MKTNDQLLADFDAVIAELIKRGLIAPTYQAWLTKISDSIARLVRKTNRMK